MLAVRLHGAGDVRLEEVAAPGAPGPHEVLVAPLWCGLCGTDAREYFGPGGSVPDEPHPLTGMQKPLILGHEFSARVTAVGEGVTRVRVGESVAVYPLVTCGTCEACVGGRPILCVTKAWVGLSTQWGGLGDLALLDESMVSPLGSIDPVLGAMVEPAAVAFQAAVNARHQAGRHGAGQRLRSDRHPRRARSACARCFIGLRERSPAPACCRRRGRRRHHRASRSRRRRVRHPRRRAR